MHRNFDLVVDSNRPVIRQLTAELDIRPIVALIKSLVPIDRVTIGKRHVFIAAADNTGFDVSIVASMGHWIVSLDDWYEDFHNIESARFLIECALNGQIRLKVERLGGAPWQWTGEKRANDNRWIEVFSGGYARFRLWRKIECVYLLNKTSSGGGTSDPAGQSIGITART